MIFLKKHKKYIIFHIIKYANIPFLNKEKRLCRIVRVNELPISSTTVNITKRLYYGDANKGKFIITGDNWAARCADGVENTVSVDEEHNTFYIGYFKNGKRAVIKNPLAENFSFIVIIKYHKISKKIKEYLLRDMKFNDARYHKIY